jgi:hypothetical protein
MKTLKTLTLAICLLATAVTVNAKDDRAAKAASPYFALKTYVSAVSHGSNTKDLDYLVENSARFSLLRGKEIMSFDKEQAMKYFKENAGYDQDCSIKTTVVNSNRDFILARVDMKYKDFVRSNYVTISNMGNIWKITDVYSTFK